MEALNRRLGYHESNVAYEMRNRMHRNRELAIMRRQRRTRPVYVATGWNRVYRNIQWDRIR